MPEAEATSFIAVYDGGAGLMRQWRLRSMFDLGTDSFTVACAEGRKEKAPPSTQRNRWSDAHVFFAGDSDGPCIRIGRDYPRRILIRELRFVSLRKLPNTHIRD